MRPATGASPEAIALHETFVTYPAAIRTLLDRRDLDCIDQATFEQGYAGFLSECASGTWLPSVSKRIIYRAITLAQMVFAEIDCKAPRHENSLTGSLQSRLSDAMILAWNKSSSKERKRTAVFSSELILGGHEQRTGADFALLLAFDDKLSLLFLQGKRSKRNNARGIRTLSVIESKPNILPENRQIHKLDSLRFAITGIPVQSAYIVYDNNDAGLLTPSLPIVKSLDDILDEDFNTQILNFQIDVFDFATFVGLTMIDPNAYCSLNANNLFQMIELLVQKNMQRIICLGVDSKFKPTLEKVFETRQKMGKIVPVFVNFFGKNRTIRDLSLSSVFPGEVSANLPGLRRK